MSNFKFVPLFLTAVLLLQSSQNYIESKTKSMKQFSLLVRVPVTYSSEQAKSVFPQWEKLLDEWKKSEVYVLSFAFPGESFTVSGSEKKVRKESVLSDNLRVVSNLVVQAGSIDEALTLAKSCPILAHGGSVEVREIVTPIEL